MKIAVADLKKILVGAGYVAEKDFDDAAQSALDLGKKVEDILFFRGIVSEDALSKLVANYLKVPYANLDHQTISDEVINKIPEKLARSYHMVPYVLEGNNLKVAMEDVSDFEAIEIAKRHTGLNVIPAFASSSEVSRA